MEYSCTRCGKKLPHQGAYLKVDTGMCSESMGLCMDCYNSYFDWRVGKGIHAKNNGISINFDFGGPDFKK